MEPYGIDALTSRLEVLQGMIKYKLLNINNIFMDAKVLCFTIEIVFNILYKLR
jgi:hypothetical protein